MSASEMDFHQVAAARAVARAVKAAERHGLVITMMHEKGLWMVDRCDLQTAIDQDLFSGDDPNVSGYRIGQVY